MIAHIKGIIRALTQTEILLDSGSVTWRILLPEAVSRSLIREKQMGDEQELVIYFYIQQDQAKGIPILIGFENEVERDFFEHFITVSGIGPKAAAKALKEPFSMIARAIDTSDLSFLKKLPGIGERKAREIVVKLQGRVGKYGLIQDEVQRTETRPEKETIKDEALAVLLQLQYKRKEAQQMIEAALERNNLVNSSEELLNEVYRQKMVI